MAQTSTERAIEAAVEAGLPREQAEQIAGAAKKPAAVDAPPGELEGGGTDRVRGWFELVGWELDEDALRSALSMLGADEPRVDELAAEAIARRVAGHQPESFKGHRWIVIPDWERFQHPDTARSGVPPWIKTYTKLLSDDVFLDLSHHLRGVLVSVWLEYARSTRQLSDSTSALSRRLGQRVTGRDLAALQTAGFLAFSASRPASTHASRPARREGERERETPTPSGNASTHTTDRTPKPEPLNCPIAYCGLPFKSQAKLDDHLANVHDRAAA